MSTTALIGTISIYLNDGEGNKHVASLLSATLSFQIDMRAALSPKYIPGKQNWGASASLLQMVDESMDQEDYLALIESAALNKTELDVLFLSPTGAEYSSSAYIATFDVGGSHEDALAGSFALQGIEALTRIEGPVLFMVSTGDLFYTMAGDFTQETNTTLDLSSYNIIDTAFNQVDSRVYGLADNGKVYSWKIDGTDLSEAFDSTYTDVTEIAIDNANQHVMLSRHNTTGFEYFTYAYTLAGTPAWSWTNRSGSAVVLAARSVSGGKGYAYIPHVGGDLRILDRMSIADGTIEFLQDRSVFGSSYDTAFDEEGGRAFWAINQYLYLYSTEVTDNPSDAALLGERNFDGDSMDYFEYGGDSYVVGCGNDRLGSFRIGASEGVADRSLNDMRLVCTRKGYV